MVSKREKAPLEGGGFLQALAVVRGGSHRDVHSVLGVAQGQAWKGENRVTESFPSEDLGSVLAVGLLVG